MIVYDLMVDADRTLRSLPSSYGLFSTYEKADEARHFLMLPSYAYYEIIEREVQ